MLDLIRRIHEDEQGAEGLEKLLILAAIILPLLIVLYFFADELKDWVRDYWDDVRSDSNDLRSAP